MRLALGWAGIRQRIIWICSFSTGIPGKFRVQASSPRMPDDYRNFRPLVRSYETVSQKKPLCCNQQGKTTEPKYCYEHRLPQARCLVALVPLPPACCSRGQVKSYFANSSPKIATGSPSVNPLYPAEIAQRLGMHVFAGRGPVGGHCVAMTQSV